MHKIITMSDSSYFKAGDLFLKTRNRLNADITLYGPDLTKKQIKILNDNCIDHVKINSEKFKTEMQFLKFEFLYEKIYSDLNFNKYQGFTFVDWDTFFINDWNNIFEKYDFDFGVTVRNDLVKKRMLRAYTNGGVIFVKHSGIELIKFAKTTMRNGKSDELLEYDEIWRTLEIGRSAEKTHSRKTLRWWCDQVFDSSLCLKYFKKHGYKKIGLEPQIFKFNDFKIGLFNCDNYNVVESIPIITDEKDIYIRHLKNTGRNALNLDKVKEKI